MLDWDHIETVLLDMDGTLLDLHFDNYFWHEYLPAHWGRLKGLQLQEAKRELIPRYQSKEGTLSWYCLDYWSAELGVDILKIKDEIKHLIRMRADTQAFLQFLQQHDKQVIMVTNAHQKLVTMKFDQIDMESYFDQVICSHDFGFPKEHIEFWQQLADCLEFDRTRTVLIDDNLTVLKTAKSFGIEHLLSILQPDSNAPLREIEDFQAIDQFHEIMP